jgi:hypothetical protein
MKIVTTLDCEIMQTFPRAVLPALCAEALDGLQVHTPISLHLDLYSVALCVLED